MRLCAVIVTLCLALTGPAAGQEARQSPTPVLTIDQDRLFAETGLGARATARVEAAAAALAAENRRIEAELVEEEQALTDRRSTLSPEEFRALADAFDAKVQRLRAEQDAKARELSQRRESVRQSFFVEVGDVLSDIVGERGAVIVIDRRDVFLSADWIDITDEAIRRVNQALGDGASEPAAGD